MNYNQQQQIQGYKCNDCSKSFSAGEVNQYCLDDSVLNTKCIVFSASHVMISNFEIKNKWVIFRY
jgi:transposase-like protein